MLMAKSMKKMLRQTFSVFEAEQYLEMRNYKYSFHRNVIIFWQMELVCFYFLFFVFLSWYILFILSFGCVAREKKKCQFHLIYDKANGNVAEWVGDSLR